LPGCTFISGVKRSTGCGVAVLVLAALVVAGFCLMVSFVATIEAESPEEVPRPVSQKSE
jgi:hypothetical protein